MREDEVETFAIQDYVGHDQALARCGWFVGRGIVALSRLWRADARAFLADSAGIDAAQPAP